jgi:6-pyruvoyltetrahydropterin/6-carboxytetrahydropterin synthase
VAFELSRSFRFEAAHRLPDAPEGHRCARLHGHSFVVEVRIEGEAQGRPGWVMDYGDLKGLASPVIDQLDHTYLNEITGLENPTAENLARWIWDRLAPALSGLSAIVVHETCTTGCVYRGR